MRRRIAALATAAPAVASALHVGISRHSSPPSDTSGERDLVSDGKTHDESHRYEASAHMPPAEQHQKEQERLNKDYRPRPPAPTPFIDATCEEICSSDCATHGLGTEADNAYQQATRGIRNMVPHAVEDAFGAMGDYFKDIAESLVPGMNFGLTSRQMKKQQEQKKSNVTSSTAVATNFIFSKKGGECLVKCKAEVERCADHIDSSDAVPETVEEYTTVPQVSRCQDIAKLRIIAETGNLKWSLRFGQSPTFGQIASLAEPQDLITQADLLALGRCAEGGDFAGINLGGAIGLAKCMVGEVDAYARSIAGGIQAVHSTKAAGDDAGDDDDVEDPTMNPKAVDPVVVDEKGEFHLAEDIFYINDVRCFTGCAGIKVAGILEECSEQGHCATDYADLLWRTGALYSPTTMGNAVKDMGYAHATDPASKPARALVQTDPAAKLQGTVDPVVAAKNAAKDHENVPAAPSATPVEEDHTSPLYQKKEDEKSKKAAPAFCKMQMCAPYPATWVKGKLLEKLLAHGSLEQCAKVEAVADVHPHGLYEGTMAEPAAPATKFLDSTAEPEAPEEPVADAREKAIERRQKTWALGALKASGYDGKDVTAAKNKAENKK